jgi:hypothetical protein
MKIAAMKNKKLRKIDTKNSPMDMIETAKIVSFVYI